MASIGSVTTNDTPCESFSDTIMVQLEELEYHICDILGPESVSHVKNNISSVQANCGKGVNMIQWIKIWVVYEELASKAIEKSTQLCNYYAETILSW